MEQKDQLLHITLMDGMVRGLLLTATHTVAEAAAIHLTSPVATAALGRTLMGTAMMGAMLKADQASVTVTIDGGGPLGRIRPACSGTGFFCLPPACQTRQALPDDARPLARAGGTPRLEAAARRRGRGSGTAARRAGADGRSR